MADPATASEAAPHDPPHDAELLPSQPSSTRRCEDHLNPRAASPVAVMDEAERRLAAGDRHPERVEGELGFQVVAHRPTDDSAAEDVDDAGEKQPALVCRHVGDVGDPESVGPLGDEPPLDQVRSRGRSAIWDRRALALPASGDPFDAELAHQPRDTLLATRCPNACRSSAWILGAP